MKNFSRSVPFNGDVTRALDTAATILLPQGFRVAHRTRNEIDLEGPTGPIHRGSLYWGPSLCRLSCQSGALALDVHMDHMRSSDRLGMKLLAAALGIAALVALFSFPRMPVADVSAVVLVLAGAFAVVALIVPSIVRQQRERMVEVYERLLQNASLSGTPS